MAKRILNADEIMLGDEPTAALLIHTDPDYKTKLIKYLNWYQYDHNCLAAKKFAIEFYKKQGASKEQAKKLDSVKETKFNPTMCFLMRLHVRGASIDSTNMQRVNEHLETLLSANPKVLEVEEAEVEVAKRPSVRDALNEKIKEYLGEVEGFLDDAFLGNATIDLYNELKFKHLPQQYVKPIVEFLQGKLPELKEALDGKDEQLTEAYGHLTSAKLKKYIKYIEDSIEGAERYAAFKKSNRKVPVRKTKPPSVQVAKLKYKREDETYKLNSILATDIIGAEQLWVFNTKNKKLGVYRATGSTGLAVRGSAITNFDPDTSMQKTLRKPDEVLTKCIQGGKLVLRKLLDEVKAKEAPMNGRVNADIILLKVVK